MIDIIISSKNRAMQLDLLLKSIEEYCINFRSIQVLYCGTNDLYKQTYRQLIDECAKKHVPVEARVENDFKKDFTRMLGNCKTDHVLFLSDDCVFIRDTDFNECDNFFALVQAFSLRLGKGLTHCLPAKLDMQEPTYKRDIDGLIMWEWTSGDPRVCYYYPFPYDSNVYKTREITRLLSNKEWRNPKTIEEALDSQRNYNKPYLLSFDKPRVISVSANQLGQGSNLPCGSQTTEYLNNEYMAGKRINLDDFHELDVTQVHVLKEYSFYERLL